MVRSSRSQRPSSPGHSSQPVASSSRSQPTFASQALNRSSRPKLSSQSLDNESNLEESVSAAVMIALSLAGSGKPFKKSDLLQGCKIKARANIEAILIETQNQLFDVYGLKLVEVAAGKYILVLPKTNAFRDEFAAKSDAVSPAFSSLLGVVLTLIFVQKGRLAEEYLKNMMLPKLFPDIKMSPHPFFGNVDKLFQEFEQQAFIAKETESRGGEIKVFYKWGTRAEHEIDRKALVLPVMKAMFGGVVPNSLVTELGKEGPITVDDEED